MPSYKAAHFDIKLKLLFWTACRRLDGNGQSSVSCCVCASFLEAQNICKPTINFIGLHGTDWGFGNFGCSFVQEKTMKPLLTGAAASMLLMGGISLVQTTQGAAPAGTAPAPATPRTSSGPAVAPAGSTAADGLTTSRDRNAAAASGNNNQAVATTSANAAAPAKGANSFTMDEAKSRIEKNGFADVTGLAKDDNGVWRGSAQKGSASTPVWLDYKGNVGEGR